MPVEESISIRFKGDAGDLEKSSVKAATSLDKVETAAGKSSRALESTVLVSQKASKAASEMATNAAKMGGSLNDAGDKVAKAFAKIASIDPSQSFTQAQQRIGASIDKMVQDALGIDATTSKVKNLSDAVADYLTSFGVSPNISLDKVNQQIDVIQNKIDNSKSVLLVTTDTKSIDILNKEINVFEAKLNNLKQQKIVLGATGLVAEFDQVNKSIQLVENNIEKVNAELKLAKLSIDTDPVKVQALSLELKGLQTKLADLNTKRIDIQVGGGVNVISEINQTITELQNKIASSQLKLSFETDKTSIQNIKKEIENLEINVKGLKNVSLALDATSATNSIHILTENIEELKSKIQNTKNLLITEKDLSKIALYNKEIDDLENQIVHIQSIGKKGIEFTKGLNPLPIDRFNKSVKNLPSSSDKASQALLNLSRVAQDAPFGFLGIANNINPLLESMQRLQKESGGTKNTLKALAGGLVGAGGLGLAVGVVSSLLIVFGDKLFGIKKSADETKKPLQEVKESLQGIANGFAAADIAKVETYRAALTSLVIPINVRTKALEEYNKVADKQNQISKSDLDNIGKINSAINDQIALYEKRALVRAAEDKLKDLYKVIFDNEDKLRKTISASRKNNAGDVVRDLSDAQKKALPSFIATGKGTKTATDGLQDMGVATGQVKEEFVDAADKIGLAANGIQSNISNARKEIIGLFQLIKQETQAGSKFGSVFEGDALKEPKVQKGEFNFFEKFFDFDFNGKLSDKQTASLLEAAQTFAKDFGNILEGLDFNKSTKEASLNAAKEFWSNYRKGIVTLKPLKLIDDITVQAPEIKLSDGANQIDDFLKGLQEGFNKINPNDVGVLPDALERQRISILAKFEKLYRDVGLELPKIIKVELENGLSKSVKLEQVPTVDLERVLAEEENLKRIKAFGDAINNGFQQISSQGFASIGEAIGAALSGGDIGNAFQAFAASIGEALQAMGKQIIGIGVAALLAKQALTKLFANPAFAIVAGTALVAAGAALKNILAGGIKGFASGGLAFGPTLGLVGEGRGTNRSNPEVIAPLNKLHQFIGGGTTGDTLVTRISGNDLELLLVRNGKRNGRVR